MNAKELASFAAVAIAAGFLGGWLSTRGLSDGVALAGKAGSPADAAPGTVFGKKFVVVDAKGTPKLKMGLWPDGKPALFAYDRNGVPRASLNLETDKPGLALLDRQGRTVWRAPSGSEPENARMEFKVTSPAFLSGDWIPRDFTCEGANRSVPLFWTGAPEGTGSFVLIADDPDAPGGTFVHWVVYDIPPQSAALPEGYPATETGPDGTLQGKTSFGRIGFGGPCPPPGSPHRYFFKLYAVDRKIALSPGASKAEVLRAIEGHVLAEAQLMGRYKR